MYVQEAVPQNKCQEQQASSQVVSVFLRFCKDPEVHDLK